MVPARQYLYIICNKQEVKVMEDIFNGSKKLGFGLMRLPLLIR